jgi:hypothetical protein
MPRESLARIMADGGSRFACRPSRQVLLACVRCSSEAQLTDEAVCQIVQVRC